MRGNGDSGLARFRPFFFPEAVRFREKLFQRIGQQRDQANYSCNEYELLSRFYQGEKGENGSMRQPNFGDSPSETKSCCRRHLISRR